MPIKGQRQIYKPWVKLHNRMLHNHVVAQLPDSSFRRFVECLLFAGEERNKAIEEGREVIEGLLPDLGYMAWTLHTTIDSLRDDLSRLAMAGLVEMYDGERWFVTNFAKWQQPTTDSERQRQYRAKVKNSKEKKEEDIEERVIDSVTVGTKQSQNVTSRAPLPSPSMTTQAHPAVKAMHQVTSYWPGEVAHDLIISKLGDAPDVETLRRAYALWMANGNRPGNFDGICDWYRNLKADPNWTPRPQWQRGGNGNGAADVDTLWQKAIKGIDAGRIEDERLRLAVKAVGGSSAIRAANSYTTDKLKQQLYTAYSTTV